MSLSYQVRDRILSFASYHSYHKESVEVQSISGCKEVQLRVNCAQSEVAKIQATLREKREQSIILVTNKTGTILKSPQRKAVGTKVVLKLKNQL